MTKTYLGDGSEDGTVLGRSATDKIAFFNATPVVQPTTVTPPVATAATSTTPFGYSQAQADAIVTWVRAVDTRLKALGIIAS
jgi:hypothetical protein